MLAITALGHMDGRNRSPGPAPGPVTWSRSAAASGRSAAGLALLQAGGAAASNSPGRLADLVAAHRRPQPDYQAGPQAAAAGATAMIDVSDGLVADLGHVAEASGVAPAIVRRACLAPAICGRGRGLAPTGVTGPSRRRGSCACGLVPGPDSVPDTWTVIGDVRPGAGVLVDSSAWHSARGWDHFRKAGLNRSAVITGHTLSTGRSLAALDITPLMPRHRRERVPRYRALRPAGRPARRVPVRAAVAATRTALESGRQDEADEDTAAAPARWPD